MSTRARSRKSALEDAREALDFMGTPILYGEGHVADGEDVEVGLEGMASALSTLNGWDSSAAPLDQILAKMQVDDSLVEVAAELIEALGQATYAGGIEDALIAERLRQKLCEGLEDLLDAIEEDEEEPADE